MNEMRANNILHGLDCPWTNLVTLTRHERPVWEEKVCPHPVLVPENLTKELEEFHQALALAITSIIERWGGPSDSSKSLAALMPLMCQEEDLINWLHKITKEGHLPLFRARAGHWRPDILLSVHKELGLSFHICEINARFISMMMVSTFQMARSLASKTTNVPGIKVLSPDVLAATFRSMFEPNVPLHFVRNRHQPSDADPMLAWLEAWTGTHVRVITPANLCLVPDWTSFTGYRLCAATASSDGQVLEQVHQAALDLYQDELRSMDSDILRHLALCSINDMREIFLLADKRILGIILHELDDLVHKHEILTLQQAKTLQEHIVPTILPGSAELYQLINDCEAEKVTKDEYIVKACRNGASENIFFGDEYSLREWNALLTELKDPRVYPDKLQFVIQPNIRSELTIFLDEKHGLCDVHLVGLYHSFKGNFSHLGHWRVSPNNRLCSEEQGGVVYVLPSVTELVSDDQD
ncbi:hypothetical protein BJY04DRAFT_226183 [Aspergillus karnatakaensis]|uniref:uncharacterized protein n=1 Tax=Aspergillus karnatakaensis TaxID=1810916 RepID=UPI003CCD8E66